MQHEMRAERKGKIWMKNARFMDMLGCPGLHCEGKREFRDWKYKLCAHAGFLGSGERTGGRGDWPLLRADCHSASPGDCWRAHLLPFYAQRSNSGPGVTAPNQPASPSQECIVSLDNKIKNHEKISP